MLITRSKCSNSKKNLIQEEENYPKDEEDIINSNKKPKTRSVIKNPLARGGRIHAKLQDSKSE